MTPAARLQAAIELLSEVEDTAPRPADRVIAGWFKQRRFIGSKDRRAISELVWGCLRATARLGWWLRQVGAAESARSRVLAFTVLGQGEKPESLLRLLESDTRYGPQPLSKEEARWVKRLPSHGLSHSDQPAAIAWEVPEWLLVRLAQSLDQDLEAELAALQEPAAVDLRVNLLKSRRREARRALAAEGIETEPGRWSPHALRSIGRHPIAATRAYRDGLVEIQDEGSQLIALLTGVAPGMRVCDFCAGAGGKSLALAAQMANKGQLVACDVLERRLERSSIRFRRAGVHNVVRRPLSSERDPWVKRQRGSFDRVLVDAPCSGSGTWRRNPEARWRLSPDRLDELITLQSSILESAARLLRPGGRLIYATCSLLREENEQQIETFLSRHENFSLIPLAELWAELLGGTPPVEGPMLRLSPARHGTDGFFLAALRADDGIKDKTGLQMDPDGQEERKLEQ
mgnify:CR=1 FL=1